MHFPNALCIVAVLMLSTGRGLGYEHQPRVDRARSDAEVTLPGGVQPEQISSTDREHLDLYNYVVQLFAQQEALNATYGEEIQLPFNNSAVKVLTSELKKSGLKYKEFYIPPGCAISPDVDEVLFVYENFPQTSKLFSGVGGDIVSPIVGLSCHTIGVNSSLVTVTPPSTQAIVVTFDAAAVHNEKSGMCQVLDSSVTSLTPVPTSTVETAYTCKGTGLGTYCITAPTTSPPPPPSQLDNLSPGDSPGAVKENVSGETDTKVVVGATLGTIAGLALLAILLLWGYRSWHRQKIARMERESERGETLQTALMFGGSRAPAAGAMRTKPRLEDASIMEDAGFLGKGTGR